MTRRGALRTEAAVDAAEAPKEEDVAMEDVAMDEAEKEAPEAAEAEAPAVTEDRSEAHARGGGIHSRHGKSGEVAPYGS